MKKRVFSLGAGIVAVLFVGILGYMLINSNRKPKMDAPKNISYGVKATVNSYSNAPQNETGEVQNTTTPGKDKLVSVNITLENTTKSTVKFDQSQFILILNGGIEYPPYQSPIISKLPFMVWSKQDANTKFDVTEVAPLLKAGKTKTLNIGFAIPVKQKMNERNALNFVGLNQGAKYLELRLDGEVSFAIESADT